ncbi:MAG: nitronate monooxygenase, partial [Ramlibacter sp.]|nr:nitronate monooxygenase [Ramlibacter sp.]
LADAQRGEVNKGLFFRGAGVLPFGNQIRPVEDLLNWLVSGERPAVTA